MNHNDLQRVSVVGTSCSGKTRFARALAEALDARHLELDSIFWLPDWKARPREDFLARVGETINAERWVIDGNYPHARELIWPKATAIIFLDLPFPVVYSRAVWRTVRRLANGEIICGDNRETVRRSFFSAQGIPWWVIRTHYKNRKTYRELLPRQPARPIVLHSPREIQNFLAEVSLEQSE